MTRFYLVDEKDELTCISNMLYNLVPSKGTIVNYGDKQYKITSAVFVLEQNHWIAFLKECSIKKRVKK